MKFLVPILACLCLAAPAAAQSTGVNTPLGAAPPTPDFIAAVAGSDMFEIRSSQLAAERSDAATKAFAAQMIADHEKTSDELKKMVDSNAVAGPLPAAMGSAQQAMLDKLQGLSGEAFTKQYRTDQVAAHKDAVSLFTRYADGGDHAGMKEWAIKTVPVLEHHLMMAQDLDK